MDMAMDTDTYMEMDMDIGTDKNNMETNEWK
jgi:hypothetical protein